MIWEQIPACILASVLSKPSFLEMSSKVVTYLEIGFLNSSYQLKLISFQPLVGGVKTRWSSDTSHRIKQERISGLIGSVSSCNLC